MRNNFLKKIGFRLLVITFIFVCVKLTFEVEGEALFLFKKMSFYYITAVLFLLTTWELSDRLIKRNIKRNPLNGLDWISGMRITLIILIIDLPIFSLVYYLGNFTFSSVLELNFQNSWAEFRADVLRALLIALTVSVFNLFYFAGKVKKNLEHKMLSLEKELLVSKYKSLKDQISPHFLFNSLNTLTSLMYEDRDLASDFTSRLASCYRYILDYSEQDIVGLDRELSFVDSFVFMMEVRHKMALNISTDITLDATKYVIPTLSLQMLIENALKHNYFSPEKPLVIAISSSDKGILVENTLRERVEKEPSTKLGLENIKKRFSFYTKQTVIVKNDNNIYSVLLPLLKNNVVQRTPYKL